MDYQFKEIEQKWQQYWATNQTFKADSNSDKPKYYVLDMFPYPSGAGLHVGHPLGYIASDIFARYKRLKGFNVLHPMGYDSFGLPAEQYAIQTGQHPAITTETNIATYRRQLDQIGFSFDWSREVRTSDPGYYKWTQWIFMQLFNSWYNLETDRAEDITTLVEKFNASGSAEVKAVCDEDTRSFLPSDWANFSDEEKQEELLKYRLTYLKESTVNWCPALGTVLANDEVKDGFSERGGFPVEQKKMMQWSMRISAYAERLLQGLDTIDWPEPVKEMQRNWIGKSVGASVKFKIDTENSPLPTENYIEVFTTRVDTIFGVSFVVLAPEHELVQQLTTPAQQQIVDDYIAQTKKKSELDRMADTKTVSGAFTGSYVLNPVNGEKVQIWIADYVLAGYGTGAVMGVPSGDQRDWLFATHFNLPIIQILDAQQDVETQADATKEGKYINSGFINGLNYAAAVAFLNNWLEEQGVGKAKINYRMRDAIFGRQRYWGEPIPVYFKDGLPYLVKEEELPVVLPEIDKYLPTESGEPPLGRAADWKYNGEYEYELSTMPGWAGSSWYWYRYMDAQNDSEFASKEAVAYWKDVDLYIGGSEHATGHLLYSRFWNKFLKDLGYVTEEEPFKKLINQGMIQGRSNFVYRVVDAEGRGTNTLVSYGLRKDYKTIALHVDVNIVENDILNIEKFKAFRPEFENAEFILEGGKYICGVEVEKMSKSKFNVVNPDVLIEHYGADTLRMYEMFLGPLEQSKPWNTNGIEGVFKFLRKFWRLFHNEEWQFHVNDSVPTKAELKALHKIIKKVQDDIERFSFNTSVSSFMIAVNELTDLKCKNRQVLEDLVVVLSPYAPHICEELWSLLGNEHLSTTPYPTFNPAYLEENEFAYPISINGKMKMNLNLSLSLDESQVHEAVLADEQVQKHLEGKTPKKIIFVKGKIVNIVI
ncbi:leucine--tRNA ligase [Pedobacter sp. KR3-3]|uniref:Leucine--tRNA ligase n=1 Tax=Pedobacter albus TaxID=3113905 RepID=A0ABU7I7A0_9SPHI|nr:leucine--tRNA ligase [Pedobacter sp. KR3-3]MEE1945342.1 leucine--tRNA ligase [Pedobacter sp. KR3-3]